MVRFMFFAFGVASHALFLAVFLYMAFFIGNLLVPKTIDSPPAAAGASLGVAVLVNVLLLDPLHRAAQRHGPPGVQAVVDAHRPRRRSSGACTCSSPTSA